MRGNDATVIEISPGRTVPSWLVLGIVLIGQFMVVLDASIVNVALPSIQRDLHFSTSGLQWIVNAYTLTFAGFLLLGGRAADLYGRRRVFLVGLTVFTVASLLGVRRVVTMSGLPAAHEGGRAASWTVNPWDSQFLDALDYQWQQVAIPFWMPLSSAFPIRCIILSL